MPIVKIADATGGMVEVKVEISEALANKIACFIRDHEGAFEDHTTDWATEKIFTRGCAEIIRAEKGAEKTAKAKAAAKVIDAANISLDEAQAIIAAEMLRRKQAAAAEAAKSAKK